MKHLYYGWVIVLTAAIILATNALIFYSFGIFLRPVTMEFNWTRGAFSAALSINMIGGGVLGILAGRLSDKYGPRFLVTINGLLNGIGLLLMSQISSLWQVYLIWGLPLSVAGSCSFVPIASTIPRWFAKKKGIAMGLTVSGFGLGGIIAPPLTQWLISTWDWQQAYIVLGLVNLIIIIPLAQFMKHSPQQIGLKPYGENETVNDEQFLASTVAGLSLTQATKTRGFWIFGFILFFFLFIVQIAITHIAPYLVDIGISATMAASIVSIIAANTLIGKNLSGFISDKIGVRLTLSAYLTLITLALIWLLFSRDAWMLGLFAVLFGIAYGGVVPLQVLLTGELFGLRFLGMILASLMLFSTAGGALGAPLAGYIFDVTKSYTLAFLICLILSVLAVTLSLILLRSKGIGYVAVTK